MYVYIGYPIYIYLSTYDVYTGITIFIYIDRGRKLLWTLGRRIARGRRSHVRYLSIYLSMMYIQV